MVTRREIEFSVINESVMRMAGKMRESATLSDEDLPPCMPDFVKETLKQAVPVALALLRLSELSKWN